MNREIKFRAWDKEIKIIIYSKEECGICEFDTNPIDTVNQIINYNYPEYEWMQYTGLKDKNGKEIYEGDIVQAVWYSNESPECETFGEVLFNNGWLSFCIWDESNKTMSEMNAQGYYTWEIEVIGNIYENPELLQGEE